jgi:DNA-binding GntR family transcriptional regulator
MPAARLRSIDSLRGPSAADLVYREVYRRIVELDLPPGSRLSEQEVARQMGISRQPVRDAFWRLSQLGLVQLQPQRATTVSLVSEEAVLQARFVRTALETETARDAATCLGPDALAGIDDLLARQEAAVRSDDRILFHALDDAFHRAICEASGHGFAWALIQERKAHMDRVRWLSLAFGARTAFDDHARIRDAIRGRDPEAAAAAMRAHLGRIVDILAQIRADHPEMFSATV